MADTSEDASGELGHLPGGRRLDDPPLQQRGRHPGLRGRALLAQEDPEDRTLQSRRVIEIAHAVVRENPRHPVAELLRKRPPIRI